MGRVVNNDVSAIQPIIFDPMVQVPLYKSLVALEIANVKPIPSGATVNIRRYGDMSAQTYTPGTPLSATAQDWAYDTIVITTYKHSTFYVDEARQVTVDIDQARELALNTAYQLRDKIDTHVFANITGADGFTSVGAGAQLVGGTKNRSVSATTANILKLFANTKRLLLQNNVEQMGDWCAVIGPVWGALLDEKAVATGFNTADATMKNGYSGDVMGFQVYVSNNLPTGICSTIAPAISAGVSSGTCKSMFFGRKGMVNLYLQPPRTRVSPCEDKIGTNYITYAVYGSGVTTKNRSRGLNVAAHAATA